MPTSRLAASLAACAGLAALATFAATGLPPRKALGQESGPPETVVREPLEGGAPEISGYKNKVVFCVDRSGSMGLGDRFATALDIVDQLLRSMNKDAQFDVYLFDHKVHSLFEDNWLHASEDNRKSLRAKIEKAGGLNYGGFTDFVSAVKLAAERRRPDAVYLLTDGVETLNEYETEKIVAAVSKAARAVKVPVHTIGIALGLDPMAENKIEAQAALRGIAAETGGVFREAQAVARVAHRPFRLWPPQLPPPAEELARVHIWTRDMNTEVISRALVRDAATSKNSNDNGGDYFVQIVDPAMKAGPIPFEYSDPKLVVRTFLANGKQFYETPPIPLQPGKGEAYVSNYSVCFMNPGDDWAPDELNQRKTLEIRCPNGGSVEFVYRRAGREFRECATIVEAPQAQATKGKGKG